MCDHDKFNLYYIQLAQACKKGLFVASLFLINMHMSSYMGAICDNLALHFYPSNILTSLYCQIWGFFFGVFFCKFLSNLFNKVEYRIAVSQLNLAGRLNTNPYHAPLVYNHNVSYPGVGCKAYRVGILQVLFGTLFHQRAWTLANRTTLAQYAVEWHGKARYGSLPKALERSLKSSILIMNGLDRLCNEDPIDFLDTMWTDPACDCHTSMV